MNMLAIVVLQIVNKTTASQSTCHSDHNQWADVYEEEIVQLY